MKKIVTFFILILLGTRANAETVKIDDVYYDLIDKGGVAVVVSHPDLYFGDVVIPSIVDYDGNRYDVTSIGAGAFSGCGGLTSVSIPNSVTSIGNYAFQACSILRTVNIPNSVTTIGSYAFRNCGLTSVIIPNSVTSIGSYAFWMCSGLTSITIPSGITRIASHTFEYCSGLTSITIPSKVTLIESSAFAECRGLTSITLSSSVTMIESSAFFGCSGLTSITIPSTVANIGSSAFSGCSELRSITIGSGIININAGAFAFCKNVTDVYCQAEKVPNTAGLAFEGSFIEFATLHVPKSSIDSYKGAAPWSGFKNVISLEGDNTYFLSITSNGKGHIIYSDNTINGTTRTFTVNEGTSATMTFVANDGYRIRSLKVNGVDVTTNISNNKYTISNISNNTTVNVTFEAIPPTTYSLTITSLGNGWVYCAEEEIYNATRILTYDEGTSVKLTFSPVTGYRVKLLSVNGSDVTSDIVDDQYTIINISNNTTVNVTFEAIPPTTYSLTISSTGSGNVTYIDNIINGTTRSYTVNEGTKAVLTITPDKGYRIKTVKVNGIDVTSMVSENLYTIDDINQNTTIEVIFEITSTYILTITSSGTGFVVYSYYTVNSTTKSFTVEGNSSVTLTFNTIDGYRLASLIVNNEDVTSDVSDNQYVIDNISRNTTVRVTFEKIPTIQTYSLTITSLGNGKVYCGEVEISNVAKMFSYNEGSSVELVLQPNDGYRLELLSVNGIDVTSDVEDNNYTINNISKNTTVTVAFEAIPPTTYSLSITSSGSGSVTYSGTTINNATESFTVDEGTSATLTFTPNTGYRIESLKVNGVDVSSYISDNKCTINEIKLNTTVSVTFEAIPPTTYTLAISSSSNGYVSYSGNTISGTINSFTVNEGSSAFLVFSPNSGYQVVSLMVDGVDVMSSMSDNQYTIRNITQDTEVEVIFEPITYLLTITSLSNGRVYCAEELVYNAVKVFTFNDGASVDLMFQPDNGYRLGQLSLNGQDVTSEVVDNQYTISNINDNTTVNVVFEAIPQSTYSLSISSSGSGYVTYSGMIINGTTKSFSVSERTSITLTLTPDSGNKIGSVKVNGSDVTSNVSNNVYTINDIDMNTTVEIEFEAEVPDINIEKYIAAYYTGGSAMQTNDLINSGSQLSWAFYNNSSVSVTLKSMQLIDGKTGSEGNIMSVNQFVEAKSSVAYSTTIGVLGIHTPVTCRFRYDYNGKEYVVDAIFKDTYLLTVEASGKGAANYNGTTVRDKTSEFDVRMNNSVTISFTPDNGYRVKTLKVNGVDETSKISNNRYTISFISKNTTVSITFEAIPPTYTLSIMSSGGGDVTYSSNTINETTKSFTVNEGTSATLTFTPNSGYRLSCVKVNDVDVTSSVSNNTYTINSINKNTTVSVTFVEELKSMTVDGVNYAVSSYDNRTVKVASGSYNNVLTVPATFTYQGMTWNVVGIDKGALADNTGLAAIIWNPSVAFSESVSNPNLLLYVKAAQYAPSEIKNVVVNSVANSITLTEATSSNEFYCPQEFTARQISYTHNYSMTTGVGECRGWETIALPFNVQTITHSSKGEIVPFAKCQEGDSRRPFWLYELTSSGWREASDIKAYTPYIISMPNNDLYYDEARLNGSITFSAQNLTIGMTEVETSTYGGRTFTPNFRNKTAGSNVYVLNVVNSLVTNTGGLTEGSQFVQNLRAVHPFEAYMTTTNNARASFGIFEDMTTSIRGITELIDKEQSKDIYNLKGQKLEAEKEGRLPAGVYIINGQKMMVK